MKHEMRRLDRLMTDERAREVLGKGEYCVLALIDAQGEPYGVPISYALEGEKIFFHGTSDGGHKAEAVARRGRATATVVMNTQVKPGKFSTAFDSVIAFGDIRPAADDAETLAGLMALVRKYSPDHVAAGERYAKGSMGLSQVSVYVMDIEYITGKHHG